MLLPNGYDRWLWVNADGSDWRYRGDRPEGYYAVPEEFATLADTALTVVVAGLVGSKTNAQKRVEAAAAKLAAIDAHADALIEQQGFTYAGKAFSLTPRAERRIAGLKGGKDGVPFPFRVPTAAGGVHTLANAAEFDAYHAAALLAAVTRHNEGMDRVEQVWAALGLADPAQGLADILAIDAAW